MIALIALFNGAQAVQLNREPLMSWAPTPKKAAFNMNYAVPHFGRDHDDVGTSLADMEVAEGMLGHKWVGPPAKPPKGPPRDYFVPHFGQDEEVRSTLAEVAKVEGDMGHEWKVPNKKDVKVPPRNYAVPNFGVD